MTAGLIPTLSIYVNAERSACVYSRQRKQELMSYAWIGGRHNLQNTYDDTLRIAVYLMTKTGD